MVTFATQNVIMDPPFTKLDILICRNLLIYLTPELQKKLLPLFHYSLNPGGILFLGSAETVSAHHRSLHAAAPQVAALPAARIGPGRPNRSPFPPRLSPPLPGDPKESTMLETRRQPPVARRPAAAAALFPAGRAGQRQGGYPLHQRANGQVSGAGGRQGQLEYFRHGPRRASFRAEQRLPEGAAANRGGRSSRASRSRRTAPTQMVDITIQAVTEPEALRGMVMIVFTDVASPPGKKRRSRSRTTPADSARIPELEQELRQLREELQTTREEMQSSQEELKSSQRGAAVHQRGAAVHQRGADHLHGKRCSR